MRRIGLAVVLAVGLALAPLAAEGQQPAGKVNRIGYLRYYGCAEPAQFTELRQGLRDLGYVEGQNLVNLSQRGRPLAGGGRCGDIGSLCQGSCRRRFGAR